MLQKREYKSDGTTLADLRSRASDGVCREDVVHLAVSLPERTQVAQAFNARE
jgi:hypothetical protein